MSPFGVLKPAEDHKMEVGKLGAVSVTKFPPSMAREMSEANRDCPPRDQGKSWHW
ncbi:MAG: hypothetical protein JST12_01715 [Armatimonadetes bacterium]|nr:hypothetical protein [Armatimonadota bacterium]